MKKITAQKILRNICVDYSIKIRFQKKLKNDTGAVVDGLCSIYPEKRVIYINKSFCNNRIASAVFHELGHMYCMDHGIWKKFHEETVSPEIAFKVENWIEWWAKKEWDARKMRKLFGHYSFSYSKSREKEILQWLKKHYN